jgi:uncharacterized membrane protein required for colicin V production
MTWLDWVVIAMIVYFILQGLFKGVAASAMGAVAIIAAFVAAAAFLPSVGAFLVGVKSPIIPPDLSPEWRRTVGFTATFVLVYVPLLLVISILPGGKRPSTPAQVLGIASGLLKAMVASMVLVGILLASPMSEAIVKDIERSPVAGFAAGLLKNFGRDLQVIARVKLPAVDPDSKF